MHLPPSTVARRRPAATPAARLVVAVAVLAVSAACGPQLTQLGARVQVAKTVSPVDCHAIGDVDGAGSSQQSAQTRLRNAAGEMHANTVTISESVDNQGQVSLHGQAFGCRPIAP